MDSSRYPRWPYLVLWAILTLYLVSCTTQMPTVEEVNSVVLELRQYSMWAWAPGIAALWADLVLPVPQTAVIAALGIIYGVIGGGSIGSFGLVTGGLLGYAVARRYGRRLVVRLVGDRSLKKVESLFDRGGMWAIVLTRSLPYSIPEAVVLVSGLGGMRFREVFVALMLGSVPTAFVFSAIGAGWSEQPTFAIALGYFLPIPLVPLALYLMHRDTVRTRLESNDRSDNAETAMMPEVANIGIVRPPLIYLSAIALGLLLHFAWPVLLVSRAASVPLGSTVVLVAVALFLYAVRTFRIAGTPVPGHRPTTTIVSTGPYRWSRNPIYLSFSLLQIGIACWVNSLWLLVTVIPAVALMSFAVIPREEQYLEARFPSDYLPYKASVRRWL